MARPLLVLGGVLATIAVVRRIRSVPTPPAAPAAPSSPAPSSPAPHVPKPPEPKPPPTVTTAPDAAPATMGVSVSLPLGWRRLDANELTPDLVDTRDQVVRAGFPVGTFAPFDLDGKHYAVLVERDVTGIVNVGIAVEE